MRGRPHVLAGATSAPPGARGAPRRRWAAALFALLVATLASSATADAPPPNVIFIVIDTLRADRVMGYHSAQPLTPFLRYMEVRGTTFRNAYATSSWTRPSVASIFTSRYPSQHLVNTTSSVLSDEELTLAEVLTAHGYTSLGYSANINVAEDTGFAQGFASFRAVLLHGVKGTGPELRSVALPEIERDCTQPCFLYFQLMEPHAPYRAPRKLRLRFGRNASYGGRPDDLTCSLEEERERGTLFAMDYDAAVASADYEVQQILLGIGKLQLLRNSIVIITADHGEELFDHGRMGHGTSLYEELVHVPLIVLAPGAPSFHFVDANVSLVDLAPTVLDLLGIAPESRFEGISLVPLVQHGGMPSSQERTRGDRSSRQILFELLSSSPMVLLQRHAAGLLRGSEKILQSRGGFDIESYDLRVDRGEEHPLSTIDGALVHDLFSLRADLAARARAVEERRALSPETQERLRQLGYDF